MPVTNRGVVQLKADTTTTLTNTRRAYFNALPPALSTLQSGLALFAIFVIARFCLTQVFTWFRRQRGTQRPVQLRPDQLPRHRIPWNPTSPLVMDEKDMTPPKVGGGGGDAEAGRVNKMAGKMLAIDPNWKGPAIGPGDSVPRPVLSRPPPAPPLTPPELSTAVFTFEQRARPVDDSFMHQPNPDYMSSTTTSSVAAPNPSFPSIPRRRSYNKTLPIGVPTPQNSGLSEATDLSFSPSSYPPTSPLLPPAPPTGAPEIDVKGEIIGVLDGEGAGWTRHTRVYGGGVCLACAASGGNHGGGGGGGGGGFYGATVPPEEMR